MPQQKCALSTSLPFSYADFEKSEHQIIKAYRSFLYYYCSLNTGSLNYCCSTLILPSLLMFMFLNRLNRLQKVLVGVSEQLAHIVQLDLRDTGLQELDVRPLCKLELLHCDRNSLSVLRVSGHTLKSLHSAHNGTNPFSRDIRVMFEAISAFRLSACYVCFQN